MLDDVPVGFARPFAECEDFLPVELVLTDDSFWPRAVRFDVDASGAGGIFFQNCHWVGTAVGTIAGIELQDHIRPGVAAEDIPGRLASDILAMLGVGVITAPH